jgi:hypothetical protein
MFTKRVLTPLAVTVSALVVGAASAAVPASHASLVIRHQVRGCHTWSVSGGPYRARQAVVLRRGGSITVTNNDVMPHTLIKTRGPAVRMTNLRGSMMGGTMGGVMGTWSSAPGVMAHMGATTKVVFPKTGVYRFTTKAGEDYMSGMRTIGEDYVLRLTVTVS